jgi:hypothetical protein
MAGDKIAGLNVQWDFPSKQLRIDMNPYVNGLLLSLNWPMPQNPNFCGSLQHQLHMAKKTSTCQTKTHRLLCCQNVSSGFKKLSGLFCIMRLLVALNAISTQQAKATVHTDQLGEILFNYIATYPNDGIVYRVSGMVLCAHADAGYLNNT